MELPVSILKSIFKKTHFVITGGVATRLYMKERMTLDMDILILSEETAAAENELLSAGCTKKGNLSIGGSTWILPDNTELDMIAVEESWAKQAIQNSKTDSNGLPFIDLPYLVLMKLRSSRPQDIADISRMMGNADEHNIARVKQIIQLYSPEDSEDMESLIYLGKLEMS